MKGRTMALWGGGALAASLAGALLHGAGGGLISFTAPAADTAVTSRSIQFFETRLAADPHNFMVAGRLVGRYLLRFGTGADLADVVRAEQLARGLLDEAPDRGAAWSRLSGVLLTQHKFGEALSAARAAVERNPRDRDALGALFDASLASGRYADAEAALDGLRPGSLDALVRRAQWLDAQGRSRGAFDAMDRVCRQLQRSAYRPSVIAWCLAELAKVEHNRTGPEAAEHLFREAVEVQPGYRGGIEGLADLAYARGEWTGARKLYRRIAADAHPDLYLRLMELSGRLGEPGAAAAWERRFLGVAGDPAHEPLYGSTLALHLAERGLPPDRDRALAVARREIERRPSNESYDGLAWVHYRRGELAEALMASDRARHWGSASPTMDYHRARILEALGRSGEAEPLLRHATTHWSLLAPHARLDAEQRGGHGDTGRT